MATNADEIIKPINKDTVHRICSGQVIVSLAIAVKELVENALDAGARNIEIRISNYGLDSIEVIDNGPGVKKENFAALTQKHCTSKIENFDDLESVATLGFRGEALSSLCALADLSITTRHESVDYAFNIKYDCNGVIVSETPAARPVGTSVLLSNLFGSLPVRRREFSKNYKRDFMKMSSILYAYCLVSKDIKFMCTHQSNKQSNVIFSTQGKGSIKDSIINIFGVKQIQTLIEVPLVKPDEAIASDFNIKRIPEGDYFSFEFLISSVTHGSGRSSADRQFYYINSRPCEGEKIAKLVNECYRNFNGSQYPFVYLNVIVKNSPVDVNVTPDKRQIFLEQEKLLLATIKMSLLEAFKDFPCTYKIQNVNLSQTLKNKRSGGFNEDLGDLKKFKFARSKKSSADILSRESEIVPEKGQPKQKALLNFMKMSTKNSLIKSNCSKIEEMVESHPPQVDGSENLSETHYEGDLKEIVSNLEQNKLNVPEKDDHKEFGRISSVTRTFNPSPSLKDESNDSDNEKEQRYQIEKSIESETGAEKKRHMDEPKKKELVPKGQSVEEGDDLHVETKELAANLRAALKTFKYDVPEKNVSRKKVSLHFSLESIKKKLEKQSLSANEINQVKFRMAISPDSNKDSEQELQKHISKDMFAKMEIIGQFNYAFIIVRLKSDLFIIDQHACDEKYNFETLQRNTILESQPLVIPKTLQFTTADETILLENEEIFNKNGFHFQYDPNGKSVERFKLTKLPLSKGYIFGKDDIDEMIFMLKEGADANCRPSRVRGMFASRACRKSVMVGKPLSKKDMRKLVDHMGEIEQPWNCPHGRPTMRHLLNLNLI